MISRASHQDIDGIKILADTNRSELGFILRVQIQEAVDQDRILVSIVESKLIGFVIYRHRKRDLQTTLAEICVSQDYRGRGFGKELIDALMQECFNMSRSFIQLKCPVGLPANTFYEKLGFLHVSTEPGKSRKLNVWRFQVAQRE